jgi:drug/metabolite transporter (DMT)-like permease
VTPLHLLGVAIAFSMVAVCTSVAIAHDATPLTVVTVRTLGTLVLLLAYLRVAGVSLAVAPRDRAIALAIGAPLCINNYLLNAAIAEIPVPLVVLIFYIWPALTAVASWALGKARFSARLAAGLALAFAGIALALDVEFTAAQAKGVWCAVGAALAWTTTFLLTGHFFHGRDTRPATFYMILAAGAVFVVACAVTRDVALPSGALGWGGLAGTGFFYAFAMIALFVATTRIGSMRTGFYMNFEPVAAVLLGALLLGQTLAPVQLAGAALVVAALFLFRPPPA